MTDGMPQPTPNQLPPGTHVQPGPVSLATGTTYTPEGHEVKVIRIEHTTGSTILVVPPQLARQIGEHIIREADRHPGPGLVIPNLDMSKINLNPNGHN